MKHIIESIIGKKSQTAARKFKIQDEDIFLIGYEKIGSGKPYDDYEFGIYDENTGRIDFAGGYILYNNFETSFSYREPGYNFIIHILKIYRKTFGGNVSYDDIWNMANCEELDNSGDYKCIYEDPDLMRKFGVNITESIIRRKGGSLSKYDMDQIRKRD